MGLIISCDDDAFVPLEPGTTSGPGSRTYAVLSSLPSTFDADGDDAVDGDGTILTLSPLTVGVDTYVVDFGDGSSAVTAAQGETVAHDYPNTNYSTDYTISVTTKSSGYSDITKTEEITVSHTVLESVDTAPASPTEKRRNNVVSIFTDGFEYDGSYVSYGGSVDYSLVLPLDDSDAEIAIGKEIAATDPSGGTNNVLELSYLGSQAFNVELSNEIVVADAFQEGIGVDNIHFDLHSDFQIGVDVLKITLIDGSNEYYIDNIALTDDDWVSFDYNLATDFSAPVVQFNEIKFELGTGGTANGHATINVDNIYVSRNTGDTILNADFEDGQDFWKWGLFTNGNTNPYGSSSDGSNFDLDGNNLGDKTAGAKWSSSQSAGEFLSSDSRFAYQELALIPGASYVLQYQYAIKSDEGTDPAGGRNVTALVKDGYYIDGADSIDDDSNNLGEHVGYIAEGKFSDTLNGAGTTVTIPFTAIFIGILLSYIK